MLETREHEQTRNGGIQSDRQMRSCKEQNGGWPQKKWQIGEQMLIPGMQTVLRKVLGCRVVFEVVEWSDDGSPD